MEKACVVHVTRRIMAIAAKNQGVLARARHFIVPRTTELVVVVPIAIMGPVGVITNALTTVFMARANPVNITGAPLRVCCL